jgi:hypothetical protein
MTNYETFVLTIRYVAFILFILAVIGIGGVLTVISAAVCLAGYYPIKLFGWLDGKLFKKGYK